MNEIIALFNGNIAKKDVDSAVKIMKKNKDLKIFPVIETGYEVTLVDSGVGAADSTGLRYSNTPAEEIPGRIVFVMTVLGRDNASKANTYDRLREIVEHQSYVYKWEFFILTDEPFNAQTLSIPEANTITISDGEIIPAIEELMERLS